MFWDMDIISSVYKAEESYFYATLNFQTSQKLMVGYFIILITCMPVFLAQSLFQMEKKITDTTNNKIHVLIYTFKVSI